MKVFDFLFRILRYDKVYSDFQSKFDKLCSPYTDFFLKLHFLLNLIA